MGVPIVDFLSVLSEHRVARPGNCAVLTVRDEAYDEPTTSTPEACCSCNSVCWTPDTRGKHTDSDALVRAI